MKFLDFLRREKSKSPVDHKVEVPLKGSTIYDVVVGNKTIHFDCPSEITIGRAKWLLQKEPGTIAWIDGFEKGAVFWDIGANVGVYSLYAAVMKDCEVFAFEPASANFYGLNNNIRANGLDEKVKAVCIAVDEKCRFESLRMRDNAIGSALHTFGDNLDFKGERFTPAWLQGAIAVPIDTLCSLFGIPHPEYVKIDVDGLEAAIVRGGAQCFAGPRLKSVLVELDLNDTAEVTAIKDVLNGCGLIQDDDVAGNVPRDCEGAQIYNLICRRR